MECPAACARHALAGSTPARHHIYNDRTYAAKAANCRLVSPDVLPCRSLTLNPVSTAMMAWFHLVKEPEGTLSRVMSFIPPLTPLVMTLRLSANPETSAAETWTTIAVMAVFVPCVIWAMARVFRTGILLYGKRPGLREVLRWLRQS